MRLRTSFSDVDASAIGAPVGAPGLKRRTRLRKVKPAQGRELRQTAL
jgi:hypothetical protein